MSQRIVLYEKTIVITMRCTIRWKETKRKLEKKEKSDSKDEKVGCSINSFMMKNLVSQISKPHHVVKLRNIIWSANEREQQRSILNTVSNKWIRSTIKLLYWSKVFSISECTNISFDLEICVDKWRIYEARCN